MNFKQDARVLTAYGEEAGHIDRVVIDPRTKVVTHLVIRQGLLFTDNRVLPVRLIGQAAEDYIILNEDSGDLNQWPKFEEAHYVKVTNENGASGNAADNMYVGSLYWYPGAGFQIESSGRPEYIKQIEQNIPAGSVALRAGAKVIAEDGKLVGHVEEIMTDSQTNLATHILITNGLLVKERRLIPTFWIRELEEGKVHLAAPASVLEKIQIYHN